jgi:hypothetical protein
MHTAYTWALIAATVTSISAAASAQTITVNHWEDIEDFTAPRTVAQLPGPDGRVSLREAIDAANNTPGPQTVAFAIPRANWWSLFANSAGCRIEDALFLTDPGTTVDFTTQTALTGDTNPGGWEVAVYYAGVPSNVSPFMVLTDGCTFKGMDYCGGNAFGASVTFYGSDHRFIGATGGLASVAILRGAPDAPPSTRNVIGGLLPEERNVLSSVRIAFGAGGNTVIGNVIRTLQVSGDTLYGTCNNNRIGGPSLAERNVLSGNRTTGEEGFPTGVQVQIAHAVGTVFEGNFVGTTEDGSAVWPTLNGATGVSIGLGAVNTVVRNNIISGIARTGSNHYEGQRFGTALVIGQGSTGTLVVGNRIGLGINGEVIPNVQGVSVTRGTVNAPPVAGLVIGTPEEPNTITASETAGLYIYSTVTGARLSGNSIYGNGALGIDLISSTTGVTANDATDADTGGNGLQNFPVLTGAASIGVSGGGGTTTVTGSLTSVPNQAYTIEFFASAACDASGFGEGQIYLGSAAVVTNASGVAAFSAAVPVGAAGFVTATAIRESTGDTSEFSACAAVTQACGTADFNGDGDVGTDADIEAFFACLAGNCCATCGGADFNADGDVGTDADIEAFFRVLAGGAC